MDEFDKIREISEDLTHRREPTFENLTSARVDNSSSMSQQNTSADNSNQMLNRALNDLKAEDHTSFTSPFTNDPAFEDSLMEEKHFPSMKIHLIGLTLFVGILAVVLAGFFIFNNEPEDISEVVTITAEPVVVKELPEQAGGINIPDQDKLVYNRIRSDNVTTKVESLFPEPEKPIMPQILSIEENTPEQKFVDMNAVKPVNPLEQQSEQKVDEKPQLPTVPSQTAEVPKEEPVVQPAPVVSASAPTMPKVEEVKIPAQPVVAPKPAEKPAETVKPAVAKNPETVIPAKGGSWRVQLFASNNKSAVEKAWQKIQSAQKSLLSGLPHEIETASIAGKGKFYRLKVGSFATRDLAADLCTKLKAHKQDCMPVK